MSLKAKVIRGLSWNVAGQLTLQFSRVIITLILARLLLPSEFGIIAMITVFSGFGNIILNFGFGPSIIQKKGLDHKDLSSIFWFNSVIGIALCFLLIVCSPLIVKFYQEPRLYSLIIFISTTFIFNAANVVQIALFSKNMNFKILVLSKASAVIFGGVVACLMAFLGYSYWSLAAQIFLTSVLSFIIIWIVSNWRPSFYFDFNSVRKVLGLSSSLFLNSFLNYIASNLDNLLIGKFYSQKSLGLYSKSFSIISIPPSLITSVISKVMLPAFSEIQDNKEKIEKIYIDIIKFISILVFPAMGLISLHSDYFVLVVFGENWIEAAPIISIFCFSGMLASINSLLGSIIISQGRIDLIMKEAYLKRPAIILGIVIGLNYGVIGVAIGKLCADFFNFGVTLFQARSAIKVKVSKQLYALSSAATGLILIGSSYYLIFIQLQGGLAIHVLFSIVVYTFLILYFESKFIKRIKAIIIGK